MRYAVLTLLLAAACASNQQIARVQAYRDARARGDVAAERQLLAPDARIWYEEKSGEGDPITAGHVGRYAHWDAYFHSRSEVRDWRAEGDAVSGTVYETNDFYRLLDWQPAPYRMTWWLDREGRIAGALVQSTPGKTTRGRMEEFREWAKAHHPEELEYLMPGGKIDPTGDRPERFKKILEEWRAAK
jgi:hypothetical protein